MTAVALAGSDQGAVHNRTMIDLVGSESGWPCAFLLFAGKDVDREEDICRLWRWGGSRPEETTLTRLEM